MNGQAAPLSQVPSTLQDCGTPAELHWRAPGMQPTPQSPCRQTNAQAGAGCQSPWPSQDCGMLPTHIFAPGVQVPTQVPAAQRLLQAAPDCQTPLGSQVCGVEPMQRRSPGMQALATAS